MSFPKTEEDQDPTATGKHQINLQTKSYETLSHIFELNNSEEATEVGNAAEWLPKVLKNRPEILEIYERSRPLTQRTTFARQFGTTTTEAKHVVSHKNGDFNFKMK